ncbi:MAG: archaeosine biosynthesis radical SAM protein RaSEA [Promethearchaeota archaeon]
MQRRKNNLLASTIFDIRQKYFRHRNPGFQPKLWSSITETKLKTVITMVIPSRGCSWAFSDSGGCSVCGYVNDSSYNQHIPEEMILERFNQSLKQVNSTKPIEYKLFNSGSFFDEKDIPQKLRLNLIENIKKSTSVSKLSVESRPEYLINNLNVVKKTKELLEPIELEIGVGFESSNNTILIDCWNKGFLVEDYKRSVEKIRTLDIRIKTYILIKPPFLTEREAINDTLMTVKDTIDIGTEVISLNPCNIQNGTLVKDLYQQDRYQSPWLWSILLIVKKIRDQYPDLEVICEPIAAGKQRGTHNCGKCDKFVLNLIERVINNEEITKDLSKICSCFLKWKFLVESPIESFRTRNLSKLRKLSPLYE